MKNLWGEEAYYTSVEGSLAIMREINRIRFEALALAWFQQHAKGVARELVRQGVRFPKRKGRR